MEVSKESSFTLLYPIVDRSAVDDPLSRFGPSVAEFVDAEALTHDRHHGKDLPFYL